MDTAELRSEFAGGWATPAAWRPVTIVDAGSRKALSLRIEVPVEDMAKLAPPEVRGGPSSPRPAGASIWSAIHPRLFELVRSHTSTLVFVNSRRTAERLAAALNELAGETLVRAHHGSLARAQRQEIEEALKAGSLRALVATSSLELGIDMGAIDLVVQIEAPPSVAAGMQRIGRAGHQLDAASSGVLFPKYRADLVACAALTRAMHDGEVEAIRYPRNPLDVLAQQLVAMAAVDVWDVDALFARVRGAAPFAGLSRTLFEAVLDMLAGRYASDEFAELRPRLTWDRVAGTRHRAEGASASPSSTAAPSRTAGCTASSSPAARQGHARVGELDEEMVFESKVGETFLLGASTWRIEEITHDRVARLARARPAGEDALLARRRARRGRSRRVGHRAHWCASCRVCLAAVAVARLTAAARPRRIGGREPPSLPRGPARAPPRCVPDDRRWSSSARATSWATGASACSRRSAGASRRPGRWRCPPGCDSERGLEVETMWTNDGIVVRFPESEEPPDA